MLLVVFGHFGEFIRSIKLFCIQVEENLYSVLDVSSSCIPCFMGTVHWSVQYFSTQLFLSEAQSTLPVKVNNSS